MEIDLMSRKVISSPSSVAKTTVFGKDDGDVYVVVMSLISNMAYISDLNGELIESFPLNIQDGVIHGHSQNYLL